MVSFLSHLSALLPFSKAEPALSVVSREADGWFYVISGPVVDHAGSYHFDLVALDPDNYAIRWTGVIPSDRIEKGSAHANWQQRMKAAIDDFSLVGFPQTAAIYSVDMPELSGLGDVAVQWHQGNLLVSELMRGEVLFGKATSSELASRIKGDGTVRPADLIRLAKPGHDISSKIFARMFNPRLAAASRSLALSWPWLCFLPPADFQALCVFAADNPISDTKDLATALTRGGPWPVTAAAIVRYDAIDPEARSRIRDERILIDLMSCLPHSWLQGPDEEFVYLATLASTIDRLCPIDPTDVQNFLQSSKGHFREYISSATGTLPGEPQVTIDRLNDILDYLNYVADEVVIPAMAEIFGVRHRTSRRTILGIAKTMATPNGGLGRLKDLSDRWHTHISDYPFLSSVNENKPWLQVFADWKGPSGQTVVMLTNVDELEAEAMTLKHCVRSFRRRCEMGFALVASVRENGVSSSTAEIVCDENRVFRIKQHRGLANEDPQAKDVHTLTAFIKAINSGRIKTDPRFFDPASYRLVNHAHYSYHPDVPSVFAGIIEKRYVEMDRDAFLQAVYDNFNDVKPRIRRRLPWKA